jgi:ribonuclease E
MKKNESKYGHTLLVDGDFENYVSLSVSDEGNELIEYVSKEKDYSKIGNIYLAKIERVENALEAAFISYYDETVKSGFLSFSDIHKEYFYYTKNGKSLKKGQLLIVQVIKDETTQKKGASFTTFIALHGKNCIFFPKDPNGSGISRNIKGEARVKLKEFLSKLDPSISLIIRTASNFATIKEIEYEYIKLVELWHMIQKKAERKRVIGLLYKEDELLKTIRAYSKHDIKSVLVTDKNIYTKILEYVAKNMIVFPDDVRYVAHSDTLVRLLRKKIDALYQKEVSLPSGGSIVIEKTEAMYVIDVNSKTSSKENSMKATAFKTNLEAIKVAVNQILLRNLSGLIVIDCIDMDDEEDIKIINKELKHEFKKDKVALKIVGYSSLGLIQISRQKIGKSLLDKDYEICKNCSGLGFSLKSAIYARSLLNKIKEHNKKNSKIEVFTNFDVMQCLLQNYFKELSQCAEIKWNLVQEFSEFFNHIEFDNDNL